MDEEAVFTTAIKIESAEDRVLFLDEACGDDTELRSSVEQLLRLHDASGDFLERPATRGREVELLEAVVAGRDHQTGLEADQTKTLDEQSLAFLEPTEDSRSLGRLDQYEILQVVGHGGMGIVLKAQDTRLNRVVAVKVLVPELASNATARKRFSREAQAAAAVSHDHVVTIYVVEEGDGQQGLPYLVMEFIDGQSLQEKIDRDGPLEVKEILRIVRQTAAGLSAAHEQGLIHRDVKPSNILLQNGVQRVQITDFGLARAVDDVGMTRTGEITGTPQYMSPEQAQGHPVDVRSDLFSLGSVLYAMCTGRAPFRAETSVATLRRVCDDTPRPIREVNPDIPDWLVAIIDRLLEKDPDERFQTADQVADLLGKHLAYLQDPGSTPFPGMVRSLQRRDASRVGTRRQRWLVSAILLLAFGLLISVTEATGVTDFSGTVVRIVTGEGTLVIEVDDPGVQISLDGEELSITGAGLQEIRLRPGQYQFQAFKDGEPVSQELVTITRGGRQVLRVGMESSTQIASSTSDASRSSPETVPDGLTWSEQIEHYTHVIERRPDIALSYVYRAKAYWKRGEYGNAIDDCTAALRIDPHLGTAFCYRGLAYYETGDREQAIADFSEAIRLAPQDHLPYRQRGIALFELGRDDSALADVEKSIELSHPGNVNSLIRAQILVLTNRSEKYRQACAAELDRTGESVDPDRYCHAARMCVLAPEATVDQLFPIVLAERAVAQHPTGHYPRQWMLYTLGMTHFRAGHLDEATQHLHASLDADPRWSARALNWLGLALVEQARGNTDKSQRWLDDAIEHVEQDTIRYPWDRFEAELLRRELESLLDNSDASQ